MRVSTGSGSDRVCNGITTRSLPLPVLTRPLYTTKILGIKLGEAVAISMLKDMRETYSEPFDGFSLTTFDGTTVTV